MLDLREITDPKTSSEVVIAQTRSKPMDYKKKKKNPKYKISGVHRSRIHMFQKRRRLWGKLTWSAKVTSNADLRSKEKSIFLITKTLFDLGNGLNSFGCSLGKVVKP